MKKILYLFMALLMSQNLLAQSKTWTGATSTNWATASNWSPSGVPTTANNAVIINSQTNQPVITGTVPTVNQVYVNANATLTVSSGGTLNANSSITPITLQGGNIINDGTINVSGSGSSVGITIGAAANITNRGTITTNNLIGISLNFGNLTFTNESTGIVSGDFKANNNILTLTNRGTINYAGGTFALSLNTGSNVINTGTISISSGSGIANPAGATITNNACGKILMTGGEYYNDGGTTTNAGFIQLSTLINTSSFRNNSGGVLKYVSLTGTITNNNGSVIVNNNPTNSTIFSYTGTFTGTVNGIFTNAAATTSAGTFTAPNTFTPSGSLPTGSQTLYAKISGACSYVVPFTYDNVIPPSITTSGTLNSFSACSGTASSAQSFTVSGVNLTANIIINAPIGFEVATSSGGTYSSSVTLTRSGTSVANTSIFVRLKSTATGTSSGNVTCTSTGATTRNVAATGTVTNSPTLTVGTSVNPTTCAGTNGSIAFTTTNLPNGNYTLNYSRNSSATTASITVSANAFTLSGLSAGTYTPFSITNNGCSTGSVSTSKVLTDPATPTLTVGTSVNPTTCAGTNGSIAFTTTNLPNATYTLNYSRNSTPTTASITISANTFTLSGLSAGTYTPFSITNNGCSTGSVSTSKVLSDPATPTLTVGTSVNPTTCGGTNGTIAFTTTNLPNATYTLNYSRNSAPTTASITVSNNTFTLSGLSTGTYTPFSITNNGCSTGSVSTSKVLTDPASPTLTVGTGVNPTTCLGTNGTIAFTTANLPNGAYTLNYSRNGTPTTASITISANTFTLTGLSAGTYTPFSITNNGCTGSASTTRTLSDPASPTLTVGAATNPTTCGGTGSIAFTSANLSNGTYSLSFTGNGSPKNVTVASNAFTLSGITAGTYSNFSITNLAGCSVTISSSRILTDPTSPTLTVGAATNPTTCGGTGSIAFTSANLSNGTYSLSFTGNGSPKSVTVASNAFTLSGIAAGTYSNFSLTTTAGCTGTVSTSRTLTDPVSPTLTAGAVTNPTTCGGTGSIAFSSTNLPNGSYNLTYTGTGSPKSITVNNGVFVLSGLLAGSYNNFSVTNAGCTGTTGTLSPAKILTDPAAPTLTAGTIANPTSCAGTNGSISFTTTNLANGAYTLNYSKNGTPTSASVNISGNAFTLSGLSAGTYTPFSITNAGCTASVATSRVLSDPASPTISAGTVINPATCGAAGSIPFTSINLPNGTYSLSFTATGTGATTSPRNVTVNNNTFSLAGLSVGSYSNFSLTSAGCTGTDATSKTIANPTTPTLVAGTAVNPTSCGGVNGSIPFTTNLPNGTYSLSYTGAGSPKSITVSGGAFTLGSLGSGGYSNFSVTNNGCVGTASISKSLNDPAAPVLTLGTTTNPSACNLADGSIAFTTSNIADGTYSLTYSSTGTSATTGPKSVTVSANAFLLSGLADGVYSNFSITNGSGCTGSLSSSVTLEDLALPALTVGTSTNPTTCTGTQGTIAFTSANLPNGTYSLNFSSTGTASPQNITVASNAFTLSGLSAGTYSNFSVTRLGCTGSASTSRTLVDPATPTLTAGASSNLTTCAGTDGSISFTTTNLSNGTYSLSFTSTGTASPKNVVVTNNTFTLSGLTAGNYSNFSLTNNGCTATEPATKTLSEPPSISLSVGTSTNPSTCSGADGSINFTTTNLPNGNYTLTYTGAGSPQTVTVNNNTFSISGLSAGAYSNFSITYLGCVGSDSQTRTLSDPASATLTAGTVTNPSTCNGTNGSITFTSTNLSDGNYSLSYTGTGSPQTVTVSNNTFTLTGLSAGNYSNFSLVSNGCTTIETTSKTLVAPATPTLTSGTVTNPSTCSGTDGSIAFATSLPNATYSLAYTGTNSPQNITVVNGAFSLTGLSTGVYSNFSIISNGCTAIDETSKTLIDPATPTLTAGIVSNPSTCNGIDGSIAFTTSLADGTYSLVYSGAGSPRNITVASGAFTLTGLQDGVYANFSITSNNCISLAAISRTLVDPATPTLKAGTVTNPSICGGADGKIAFTTSIPNGTYNLNFSGGGSPKNITVVSGAFELTGLSSGTYSGFSVSTNGCTGTDATAVTLTDPAAPTFTAGAVTNPTTCSSSDGKIAFTTSLPNGTYTLNYTGTGSPKNVTVANGVFELTGLPDGMFSGFSITVNGCTGTDATAKTLTDPAAPTLTAGTVTNPSTCSNTDGSIAFTTNLPDGTYTLNYTGTGSPKSINVVSGAFTLTGLPNGVFSGFSVTTGGCTGVSSANITLTDPTAPTITAGTVTNPSSCNGTDGSIAFTTTLPNGDYTLNYTGSGSPKTITVTNSIFTLSGLPSGNYSGFSITTGGCVGIDNTTKSLINPNPPTLFVGTATNPSTCSGTGNINFTTNLPDGIYNLTYTGAGSPKSVTVTFGAFTLSELSAGTYSNFSIENGNGCSGTDATSKTISAPLSPTLTIGVETNPSTCSGADGSIAFTTNLPNGTYSLSYTGTGSPKNVTVANGAFILTGLSAGTYSNFIITSNGCTGSDATSKTISDPLAPSASISGNDNLNCSTTSVTRTASGGTSYLWSNGLGTNANVSISTAGTYTVTVTQNGCTATATTSVTFTNNLIASATNAGPYQVGNTIELNASGGSNYLWSGPNNFISTSQNPTITGALLTNAGVYTVTVSTGACSATATTNVVVEASVDPCIPIIDYQFVKAGNPYQPLFSLTNGMLINQLPDPVSIIAVPICPTVSIESLKMQLQGPNVNEEIIQNISPYAIFDNTANNLNGRVLIPGIYTLTITGYNQDNLLGNINYGPVITTFTILPNMASIAVPSVSKTALCIGSNFDVSFSTTGTFNLPNQFRVELSDANGNFGSIANLGNTGSSATFTYPTIIGTSNSAGMISCSVPNSITGGTNYRIRVVSTDGVSVSQVNNDAITIYPKDLNFVSPTDDFTTNIGTKQASNKVSASNKINATASVSYQAGKAIILNAGFEANAGTVFKAEIKGCNN